jgi:uncharacterized protein YlzI (FlbEa/FlbD family)
MSNQNPQNVNFAKANMVFGYVSREPELLDKMSEATVVITKKNGEDYVFQPEIIEVVNRITDSGKDVAKCTKAQILEVTRDVLGLGENAQEDPPAEDPPVEDPPAEETPAEDPPVEDPPPADPEEDLPPPPAAKAPVRPASRTVAAPVSPAARPVAPVVPKTIARPVAPATAVKPPVVAAKTSVAPATPKPPVAAAKIPPKPATAPAPTATTKAAPAKAPAGAAVGPVSDKTFTLRAARKELGAVIPTFALLASAATMAKEDTSDGADDRRKNLGDLVSAYGALLD